MRDKFPSLVEKSRTSLKPFYPMTKPHEKEGYFKIKSKGNIYFVIISYGFGWDHVSVSLDKKRCPTWEEMCWIKDLFFDDEECVVQYHPKKSEYRNLAIYALHLWRFQPGFPTPPPIMVAP